MKDDRLHTADFRQVAARLSGKMWVDNALFAQLTVEFQDERCPKHGRLLVGRLVKVHTGINQYLRAILLIAECAFVGCHYRVDLTPGNLIRN